MTAYLGTNWNEIDPCKLFDWVSRLKLGEDSNLKYNIERPMFGV